jgi:ketosteroid isomerase-like protein
MRARISVDGLPPLIQRRDGAGRLHRPRSAAVLTALLLITGQLRAQQETRKDALASLVAAERAFSQRSVEHGIKAAFLVNLGANAIAFRPGPVNGRKVYEEQEPSPAMLVWSPEFADVSNSGDLGFTTGPYELRPGGASDTVARYGHYVTLWRRPAGGAWEVALDFGISHAARSRASLVVRERGGPSFPSGARARDVVLAADSLLGEVELPEWRALAPVLSDESRIYRGGKLPVVGIAAGRQLIGAGTATYDANPLGGEVASSGDLAYTYGRYLLIASESATGGDEEGYYLRIWRRMPGGNWRVVLDLSTPNR